MKLTIFDIVVLIALIGNIIIHAYEKQITGTLGWIAALLYFISFKGVST